ncbi:outer membrane lipid asymmetry maintenance protein MlaD [Pseudooceanicola sp. HF7]|uniref:outer membrane lipid asymmetry maintenance protein MlaD n=1 Tax=Pseudooceanicola sp. HF7 TaxID=2721560 RepID=UPI00142F4B92|nr:outer membrane lipid asymmetry maintenance protein MlaD [Pseudooceanicola sp. HF7]NIZ09961.1 outer membrane lipid asymmetry maintenance protein MlaD [Pseudooceanicola sp. HF7]
MAQNKTEVIVGAGVLAVAVGFVIYAGQLTGLSGSRGYPLSASFRSVEGINVGTDVRLAGVKVGSVTGIDLDAETFRAQTKFTVQEGVVVPDDSQVVISSEGLLGGNFVEILPGGSTFNYEAGEEVMDTQGSVSLISLLLKFVAGGGSE